MSIDVVEVQDVAAAVVTGATGVALRARGCATARTGAGVYTITVNPNNLAGPDLPRAESVSKVQVIGTTDELTAELVHTSNTVKTITIRDSAGADADGDFNVRLSRLLG